MSSTAVPQAGVTALPVNRICWGVLFYNIFVVVWGAMVRATGSGAGCGDHWPLCNGQVLPVMPQYHTIIEFTHRLTSGLALLAVVAMFFLVRGAFAKGHLARRAASWALLFIVNETLIGAVLVLLRLVAESRSPWRGVVLTVHLVNTMLLLAAIALSAWWSAREHPGWDPGTREKRLAWWMVGLSLLTSAAGGVAALGDTLFPATSLSHGLTQDFGAESPLLVRLRVLHPVIAIGAGGFFLWAASRYGRTPWANAILALTLTQFALGGLNILLLTPVWTQLAHLLLADLLWVSVVLFLAELPRSREQGAIV